MNLIVLTARGLHLGYLGCYGNTWIETPGMDRFAAEGIVFDQHFAGCPDPGAARKEWRSGLFGQTPNAQTDLLALLRAHGVQTHLLLSGTNQEWMRGWGTNCVLGVEEDAQAAISKSLEKLETAEKCLLWLDVVNLLPPWKISAEVFEQYANGAPSDEEEVEEESVEAVGPMLDPAVGPLSRPADEMLQRLQSTYAAAVTEWDKLVIGLLEELEERGIGEKTLVIITTAHGQALGEHGFVGPYRPWLHDELVHIPLLMRLPNADQAGRRVIGLTQSLDLYATVLDAFGIKPPSNHGSSLLPMALGKCAHIHSQLCLHAAQEESEEWSLRTEQWNFILPIAVPPDDPVRTTQLYVKPDDRWEVNNVIQHHLDLSDRLEQTLRAFMAAPGRLGLEMSWQLDTGGTLE